MKLSRLLALLMVLVLLFGVTACRNKTAGSDTGSYHETDRKDTDTHNKEKISASSPLLYRVTDDSGNVLWLFGSIHVGRDDFYPLPDYVLDAFDGSDRLAVEFDIIEFEDDMSGMVDALMLMTYTDGTTIKDHIDEELYQKAVEILEENNYYNSALDYYIPALWSSFIDSALYEKMEVDIESGIDRHLIERAYDQDKDVLDIESARLQYGMMASFSQELQILLLESSVKEYYNDNLRDELDEMMDVWAKGDEESFAEMLSEEDYEFESEEEKNLYEEYNNALIVKRNEGMTKYAEEALLSGDEVFICVGAAHIVGEGALAQLLSQRGYNVELVR